MDLEDAINGAFREAGVEFPDVDRHDGCDCFDNLPDGARKALWSSLARHFYESDAIQALVRAIAQSCASEDLGETMEADGLLTKQFHSALLRAYACASHTLAWQLKNQAFAPWLRRQIVNGNYVPLEEGKPDFDFPQAKGDPEHPSCTSCYKGVHNGCEGSTAWPCWCAAARHQA